MAAVPLRINDYNNKPQKRIETDASVLVPDGLIAL